ncbi:branched-chain amino acid ABC transporter permease [Baia soyae]|uniref:Branched-chain amino acid transport system permease protein n=1 Tax=Baia soyae TaxID=1544746 RepID=A0A4V2SY21_9BACL|nr:branched-chain amino acid ABC transporter permease [Baia soyae]TCP68356.1 branched-chain amino acid transport system permease protein [Baia soyae]
MKKLTSLFSNSRTFQSVLILLIVLCASTSLYLMDKSVTSFLLLLCSFLLLYYTTFSNWIKWGVGALIAFAVIPVAASGGPSQQVYMEVAVMAGIYIAMALGLNIVVGFAGLLDLGFVAFFALGAYVYGIFASPQAQALFQNSSIFPLGGESFWLFIIIGALVAALFGIILGVPVLRVKGDYLAIVTLGFGEIIRIVFNNLDKPVNITNGALGISGIPQPKLFGFTFTQSSHIYFVVLIVLGFVIYAVRRFEDSKLGRSWKAIREDEIASQAMGIPLVKTKLWAFALGASFSGMMGVLFAAKNQFVDPTSFTLLESITILVMVILGGMGSVPGVILGAAIISILNLQILTEITLFLTQNLHVPEVFSPAKMQRLLFGLVLVGIAIYRPQGLIPAKNKTYKIADLKAKLTQKKGKSKETTTSI